MPLILRSGRVWDGLPDLIQVAASRRGGHVSLCTAVSCDPMFIRTDNTLTRSIGPYKADFL